MSSLVLVLLAKVWFASTINSTVNNGGPTLLGVPVSVESVQANPLSGKIRIQNFIIGNPEGFESAPHLFKADVISIDISPKQLLHGKIHIRNLVVDNPHVWYYKKLTSCNFSKLLDILEEKYPRGESRYDFHGKDERLKKTPPSVIIDHILVKDGSIGYGYKPGAVAEVPLREIELRDIGKDNALMPDLVAKILVATVFNGVIAAYDAINEPAIDAVESANKGVISVSKGIGSLFGGFSDANTPDATQTEGK